KRKKTPGAKKIRNKELPAFTRQLSAMLGAGMSIVATLDGLHEQTGNKNFKIVIEGLKASIEGGASFSEALLNFPDVFEDLYVNMIRSGETSGQLAETAARVAGFLESSARLKRKVKSAMAYPVIVLCIALGIAALMIIFIVPVFSQMFADFGAELPGPTQFLVDLSGLIRHNALIVSVILIAGIVAFKKWRNTPAGAYAMDKLALKIPVIGMLTQKVAISRFARTFAQLSRSGVPILSTLEIVAGATGNKVLGKAIKESRLTVERGEPLSTALVKCPFFPRLLIHMLAAGEKTGKIDDMMQNIADFYDDEVETMLEGLMSLMEPLLIVFLGVIIGGIVICMFMPIFKMHEVVQF
ncbi:MAG: type II secretion system F family protein, partial [Kiritimatiellae bacterium]|nr:type II secretion system F family protein [Kiritimatiellia bacterium]